MEQATRSRTSSLEEHGMDALLAVVNGVLFLDFDREAPSLEDAIQSAARDIERWRDGGSVEPAVARASCAIGRFRLAC